MEVKSKIPAVQNVLDSIKKDHVSESAAQCAYYVILSFIPFVILLLTLIQYTSIEPQQLFDILSNIIPANANEMIMGIVREVYSRSIGTISITLIFTIFSADRSLFALTKGLHQIYNFNESKNKSIIYLKLVSLLETIVFILSTTITLIIMVFGKPIISTIKSRFGLLQEYTIFSEIMTLIAILLALFIVFILVYRFMSGRKTRFRDQILGAAFTSIGISIVSFIFSRYLDIFKGFSITYGSLTALMLVMMWTYACFYIIFIGAEINKFHKIRKDK